MLVKGDVVFDNRELDDLIIARSDGTPTYNFCVVVDDIDMAITHIIRGDDHLSNTPRQIQLYQAFGAALPQFAHVPLILGTDKARLSKRHGATSVTAYRDMGYLPEAVVNYLVRLGWSHGDQEIFSREELIEKFSLESVGKSAGVFNPEKFLWLNSHYLKTRPLAQLADEIVPYILAKGYAVPQDKAWLQKMIRPLQERAKTLVELVEAAGYFLKDDIVLDEKAATKFLTRDIAVPLVPSPADHGPAVGLRPLHLGGDRRQRPSGHARPEPRPPCEVLDQNRPTGLDVPTSESGQCLFLIDRTDRGDPIGVGPRRCGGPRPSDHSRASPGARRGTTGGAVVGRPSRRHPLRAAA